MAKKKKTSNALRYPVSMRIDESTDYLEIRVKEYRPPGLSTRSGSFIQQRGGSNGNTIITIQLPIPNGVTDSNSVAWDEDSANALELAGAEAFKKAVKDAKIDGDTIDATNLGEASKKFLGSAANSAKKFGNALDPNVREQILNYFGAKAVGIFGSNMSANSLTSRSSGQVLNPNMELLFKGVQLRTFPFSFSFTPRSRDESLVIKQIINVFKRSMAAKTTTASAGSGGDGIFIQSPDIFELRFMRGGRPHPFLFSMKPMALKNMNVNYSDTGAFITYEDSTPVKMSLNLSFTELNPIYAEDYNSTSLPGTNEGVGF
jgi:hypothetical protein